MASDSRNLQISAIVCTYSNASLLRRTLDSLIKQTLPPREYEIVVVDNNSTDNTREVVREFEERASHQIKYVLETTQGLSAARNTGIKQSSGPIISFIDDDAEADPGWLAAVVKAFNQHPEAWGVGGNTFAIWDAERPAWLTDDFLGNLSIQDRGPNKLKLIPGQTLLGTNCSFRREVFAEIGYFPTDLGRVGKSLLAGEEAELCLRIHLRGKSMYHVPDVIVYHHVTPERMTRSYFRKRCYLSGLSRASYVSRTDGISFARNELRGRWLTLVARFLYDVIRCLTLKRPQHTLFRYWTWFLLELGYTRGLRQGFRMFFGIGGIFFLAIIGLYIAGALVEPLRWYLIGTASGLLLLGGGVLVLLYARFILIRIINDQKNQIWNVKSDLKKDVSDLKKDVSDLKKSLRVSDTALAELKNEISKMNICYFTASGNIIGPFKRDAHAHINENALIAALLVSQPNIGIMLDVGAMHGATLSPFLHAGWRVFAFEPDPANRKELEMRFGNNPNLTIDGRAVADRTAENVPFYASTETRSISSLYAFHETHRQTCTVSTTTIANFVREKNLHHIDYLKIDAEGYDLLILKGVSWDNIKPNVIMCEFEDRRTRSLGYTMHDMAHYLTERCYTVLVSEWHPIIRYGIKHDWHRLVFYPYELNDRNSWGNLIAFLDQPDLREIATIARRIVRVDAEITK